MYTLVGTAAHAETIHTNLHGSLVYMTSSEWHNIQDKWVNSGRLGVWTATVGHEYEYPLGLCTDTTYRRVPGKLVDGYCYVGWYGKEYRNTEYYAYVDFKGWQSVNYYFFLEPTHITEQSPTFGGFWPCIVDHLEGPYPFGDISHSIAGFFNAGACIIPWKSKLYAHYGDSHHVIRLIQDTYGLYPAEFSTNTWEFKRL